jgi:hypothetical protein
MLKRSTTLQSHLKLWLIAQKLGYKMLTIIGRKNGRGLLFARTAKMANAKKNGVTRSRMTVVLLTTPCGLPLRLTAYQELPLPQTLTKLLLLLRTPSVNLLSTK